SRTFSTSSCRSEAPPRRRGRRSRARYARRRAARHARADAAVSRLRAKCPDCRTLTAVALGPDYRCHSCGREFGAGMMRVPRAWGDGGEGMAEAARLSLPYPEVAVVDEDTLRDQVIV